MHIRDTGLESLSEHCNALQGVARGDFDRILRLVQQKTIVQIGIGMEREVVLLLGLTEPYDILHLHTSAFMHIQAKERMD